MSNRCFLKLIYRYANEPAIRRFKKRTRNKHVRFILKTCQLFSVVKLFKEIKYADVEYGIYIR